MTFSHNDLEYLLRYFKLPYFISKTYFHKELAVCEKSSHVNYELTQLPVYVISDYILFVPVERIKERNWRKEFLVFCIDSL